MHSVVCRTQHFCSTPLHATRKMCAVLQNVPFFRPAHLGKGPAARPVAYPQPLALSNFFFAPSKRIAVSPLAGRSFHVPPAPHDRGNFRSPLNPIDQGAFHSPCGTPDRLFRYDFGQGEITAPLCNHGFKLGLHEFLMKILAIWINFA